MLSLLAGSRHSSQCLPIESTEAELGGSETPPGTCEPVQVGDGKT